MLAGALPSAGGGASEDWVADAPMDSSAAPLVHQSV